MGIGLKMIYSVYREVFAAKGPNLRFFFYTTRVLYGTINYLKRAVRKGLYWVFEDPDSHDL